MFRRLFICFLLSTEPLCRSFIWQSSSSPCEAAFRRLYRVLAAEPNAAVTSDVSCPAGTYHLLWRGFSLTLPPSTAAPSPSEPPGQLGGFSSPHRCKPNPSRKHGTDWDETSIPDVGDLWIRSYDQFQPQHENFRQHGSLLPSFLLSARNGACLTIVHLARAVNQPEVFRRDDLVLGPQYRCASASSTAGTRAGAAPSGAAGATRRLFFQSVGRLTQQFLPSTVVVTGLRRRKEKI